MLSPGREHDLRKLDELIRNAKSIQERDKWRSKAQDILKEGDNKQIVAGREKLIDAIKRNDTEAMEEISDYLHDVGRDVGRSK